MLKYNNVEHSNHFRLFIDTGYFPCAFGLIFVYDLLTLVSLGLPHF